LDHTGWNSGPFAEALHRHILHEHVKHGSLSTFKFDHVWTLFDHERVSINCMSWMGSDFVEFGGVVGRDEEQWLTMEKPKTLNRCNRIYGGFNVVHYAFYTQRPHLDTTDILKQYANIIAERTVPL
jgi:hypothetical protein